MLVVMHVALLGLLLFTSGAEATARRRARARPQPGSATASLTVTRSDRSMAILAGIFAAAVGLYALAIEVADVLVGHKSFLILVDLCALAYLFFYNNWFRNALIGTAMERHKESR